VEEKALSEYNRIVFSGLVSCFYSFKKIIYIYIYTHIYIRGSIDEQ